MGIKGGFWKIVRAWAGSRKLVDFKTIGKDVVVAVDGFVWLHQLCAVHVVDVMQVGLSLCANMPPFTVIKKITLKQLECYIWNVMLPLYKNDE